MARDGGDYAAGSRLPESFQFAEDTGVMPLHISTHVNARCHAWYADKLYNGHSGNGIGSTPDAARLGVDKTPPIVTLGILPDLVRVKWRVLTRGESISPTDLQAVPAMAGIEPEAGDAVLPRAGWLESPKDVKFVDFKTESSVDIDAAAWLVGRDADIVKADNFAVEVSPFPGGEVFPVHQYLTCDLGVPLVEGLMLKPPVESERSECPSVASALPVMGATGSPFSPVEALKV